MSTNYFCKSVAITTAGNYTSAPTVHLSDTNLGMTITSTIVEDISQVLLLLMQEIYYLVLRPLLFYLAAVVLGLLQRFK
jgi:hypothetical protein